MTSSDDKSALSAELNRLLVAAILGDATDRELGRLNELLLSSEELRDGAARFFEEEVALRREFEILDRVGEFHGPRMVERTGSPASSESGAYCAGSRDSWRQRSFVAVAILLSSVIGWLTFNRGSNRFWAANPVNGSSGVEAPFTAGKMEQFTASILTPVTRVSWSGPQFASELNATPMIASIREGVISFTSSFGRPAQGYLVCLRPGLLMDLIVTADAEGENALAVIEIDSSGRPTGRRFSFSNSAEENPGSGEAASKYAVRTKKGRLGIWTERNDGSAARYYLLTGVHKLLNRSADDSWHVSRLLPFVESANLIHMGWDDSGMLSSGELDPVHIPDNDFDDVSATVRIRKSATTLNGSTANVLSKTPEYDAAPVSLPADDADRFPLSVGPGQSAIVKVCSRSGAPVEVSVFDKETGELRWRCRQELNADSPTLGICALQNDSPRAHEFLVVGTQKEASADRFAPAHSLPFSVLFDKENVVTVGFGNVRKTLDFNLLKVDILTMGEL